MIKRRKDGGFTLIELMIVIAVIGILAVVLVPKMTNAKDSAKEAGVVTNAKSVEMFVVANIDRWERDKNSSTEIGNEIEAKFINGNDKLSNPFTGNEAEDESLSVGSSNLTVKDGIVTVLIEHASNSASDLTITIKGYGAGSSSSTENKEVYKQELTRN